MWDAKDEGFLWEDDFVVTKVFSVVAEVPRPPSDLYLIFFFTEFPKNLGFGNAGVVHRRCGRRQHPRSRHEGHVPTPVY